VQPQAAALNNADRSSVLLFWRVWERIIMAALSEHDRRVIFGDDAMLLEREMEERNPKKEVFIDYSERKFTAAVSMVIGVCLLVSALRTAEGTTFLIQNAVAALFFFAGLAWYVSMRRSEASQTRSRLLTAEAEGT
jgi:hypothetical protein